MPKAIGSADLAAIYSDPQRALAEAAADRAAVAKYRAAMEQARKTPAWYVTLTNDILSGRGLRENLKDNNAKFKAERARFALTAGKAVEAPIFLGMNRRQLAIAGVVAAGVVVLTLFF